jgi:5-methylcytosine-specific restriction endonuclease McrA
VPAQSPWYDPLQPVDPKPDTHSGPSPPSMPKHAVFRHDRGQCVECGSDFDIQYDHVIPLSMGGSSTVENLQLLCATCNRRKGGTLG